MRRHFLAALPILCSSAAFAQGTTMPDSLAGAALARTALSEYRLFASRYQPASISMGGVIVATMGSAETPAEHAAILTARLDSAARLSPADVRITAIRVFTRVVLARYRDAESIVDDSCRGPAWLCSALRGFVLHKEGQVAVAESAFRSSLAAMPADQRCSWDDVSNVMNQRDFIESYRSVACESRADFNNRIWWLSQPLWMEPGNERRTEHYSRWVSAEILRMQADLLGDAGFRTDSIHATLSSLLRMNDLLWSDGLGLGPGCQGPSAANRCVPSFAGVAGRPDRFIPAREPAANPFSVGVLDKALAPALASGLSPADVPVEGRSKPAYSDYNAGELYSSRFGAVHIISDAQVAVFGRGDEALVLAAFNPRDITGYPERAHGMRPGTDAARRAEPQWRVAFSDAAILRVGVAISTGPAAPVQLATVENRAPGAVRIETTARFDSAMISLEARDDYLKIASRHRFGIFNPTRSSTSKLTTSDILMYVPAGSQLPASVSEALPRMLPRSAVQRNEKLGLFWELQGLSQGDSPEFEVRFVREEGGGGLLRALAQSFGLQGRAGTLLSGWRGPATTASSIGSFGETSHSIVLDISSLARGTYTLAVSTRVTGREVVTTTRAVRVE